MADVRSKAELIADLAGKDAEIAALKAALVEHGEEGEGDERVAQLLEAETALEAEKAAHADTKAKLDMVKAVAEQRGAGEGEQEREKPVVVHSHMPRAGFHPAKLDDMPDLNAINGDAS